MGEMRSDNTHYTRYKADRGLHILYRENIADFVVDDQNQWTNEMYYACYTGISRANTILNRIEGTTFPDDFKNKTIGEAKFIRAMLRRRPFASGRSDRSGQRILTSFIC